MAIRHRNRDLISDQPILHNRGDYDMSLTYLFTSYDVGIHAVVFQSAGLLLASFFQPMSVIPQTMHA